MTEETDSQNLIQKHLDGLTSEEEAALLSEKIIADPQTRADYLKAAGIHGALGDETLELDPGVIPFSTPARESEQLRRPFALPRQLAAAIITGAFMGVLSVGVVWAVNSPRSEAIYLPIGNGDFEDVSGPVANGFPTQFDSWSGNPAEIVAGADGDQSLRFLETGNVMGIPDGGASNCSVFQWVDLRSLQHQWNSDHPESHITLELSARFRREAADSDADLPKLEASIRIFLLRGELESHRGQWPKLAREADALGSQSINLAPGDEEATIFASCLLNPEATIALIAVSANARNASAVPVELGGYYVDDVQLTATKQPNLPVKFTKRP